MWTKRLAVFTVAAALAGAGGLDAQERDAGRLPVADAQWELRDSVTREVLGGIPTLTFVNGFAIRRDVAMQDGTIDVDVMTSQRRSFVYVTFRMQSEGEHEELYLRPHKSGLPDAIQYAPVYQGQSAWQLYHGANGTAAPEMAANVWNHLRIVLRGRQAAVFLGDTVRPVLVIPRLGHEPRAGYIALRAFLPAGTPGAGPIARFANVRVRPNVVPFSFPPERTVDFAEGVVRSWRVSEAFTAPDTALMTPPPAAASDRRVTALPSGLVELHRQLALKPGMRNVGTVARLVIDADTAGVYRMDVGFSDRITALLDGRPIFHRDDSYNFENRRDGLIGFDQATLYLPLRPGRNELALIVTDRFGGWGLMGRFPSTRGIRLVDP